MKKTIFLILTLLLLTLVGCQSNNENEKIEQLEAEIDRLKAETEMNSQPESMEQNSDSNDAKKAEEEAAIKKAEEEAAIKKAEEEAAIKKAEEEAAIKKAEEEAKKKRVLYGTSYDSYLKDILTSYGLEVVKDDSLSNIGKYGSIITYPYIEGEKFSELITFAKEGGLVLVVGRPTFKDSSKELLIREFGISVANRKDGVKLKPQVLYGEDISHTLAGIKFELSEFESYNNDLFATQSEYYIEINPNVDNISIVESKENTNIVLGFSKKYSSGGEIVFIGTVRSANNYLSHVHDIVSLNSQSLVVSDRFQKKLAGWIADWIN